MIMSCAVVLSTAPFEVGKRPILAVFGIFGGLFRTHSIFRFQRMIAQNYHLKKLTRGRGGALDAPMKFSRNVRRKTPRRPIYGTRDPRRVKGTKTFGKIAFLSP